MTVIDNDLGDDLVLSEATGRDYFALLKPRVMSLVVFTAFAGLFLAPGSINPVMGAIAILCIAIGAGAAGALNMWYDADIDAVMSRTANRPIPAGRIGREEALAFGIALACFSVATLGLAVNWFAAGFLAFTIFYYAVFYTMWLKRATPQNIVIGGAAGAFPPMVGWAAVTGSVSLDSIILFSITFLWTPPHFWALALVRNEDYQRANIPMMPVVAGAPETRRQILIYAALLAPLGVLPTLIGISSVFYGLLVGALGVNFIRLSWKLFRQPSDDAARRLFGFSIIYLFLLFLALVVDHALVAGQLLAGVI